MNKFPSYKLDYQYYHNDASYFTSTGTFTEIL